MLFVIPLIIALLLESTITTVPVVLSVLVASVVIYRSSDMYLFAFIAGLVLDLLLLRQAGQTGMFYTILLLLIFLYQRKFEISTLFFVGFVSFFGAYCYTKIFAIPNSILNALATVVVSFVLFLVFKQLYKTPQEV